MKYFTLLTIAACVAVSCKKKVDEVPTADTTDPYLTQKNQVKATYATLAFTAYNDALVTAKTMQTAINDFVANPTQVKFNLAKTRWKEAREVYGLTEIFRFADGPIDNESDGPEGLINPWPMDEAYVDYVQGAANSGIINNTASYPTIDAATIVSANEFGGEENISAGYHAIEFLLWGQDFDAAGPGNRPYTDYLTTGGTASNQARRGTYLKEVTNLLIGGLTQVKAAWDPAVTGNYRATFLAMENGSALRKMFNSMRVLSGIELAGERIYTAYENQDQEDEHSCFSDNTHRDIYLNAKGISNLYNGTYTTSAGQTVSGYSLSNLVSTINSTKNTELNNRFITTENFINGMYIPFDQAIILPNERPKVLQVVTSLQAEQAIVISIAGEFGFVF